MRVIACLLAAILLLGGTAAYAGGQAGTSSEPVRITRTGVDGLGHYYFYFSSNVSNSPSCAQQPATGFEIDGTTEEGKVQVTWADGMYALTKLVVALGTGECDADTGYEMFTFGYSIN
jgi:hypothetical protein